MDRPTARRLHVFFFPFLASGHILPLVDLAALLADRGVEATVVTTHANALIVRPTIDRAVAAGRRMRLLLLRYPAAEVGMPADCENTSSFPWSPSVSIKFLEGFYLLQQPLEVLLREHRPDCLVSDALCPWTSDLALAVGIPRIVFQACGALFHCVLTLVALQAPNEAAADGGAAPFLAIDCLPHLFEISRAELPEHCKYPGFLNRQRLVENESYGVVVNTFYELEPEYVQLYRKLGVRKAWCVGPVSLRNSTDSDKVERGEKTDGEVYQQWKLIKEWLDSKPPASVIYISFGSQGLLSGPQLRELAVGLEAAGHPFIWAVKSGSPEHGMPEGFAERMKEKGMGLVVRRWAPQVAILEHRSVGGFLTHCGWNSVMEAVSAGVPMVAWPLHSDHFINERLVVDVLRIGVRALIGVKRVAAFVEDEKEVVKWESVRAAVDGVMGGGDEAIGIRKRAEGYKEPARSAVQVGGSSYEDVGCLIEDLTASVEEKERMINGGECCRTELQSVGSER